MKKVAVIMGSDSDLKVMSGCIKKLREFGVPFEAHVMSAHRTPAEAMAFAGAAAESGFGVLIAAAGKAAHLAGVLAAHTVLPVIGVPIKSSTMDGLDSLLSTGRRTRRCWRCRCWRSRSRRLRTTLQSSRLRWRKRSSRTIKIWRRRSRNYEEVRAAL